MLNEEFFMPKADEPIQHSAFNIQQFV